MYPTPHTAIRRINSISVTEVGQKLHAITSWETIVSAKHRAKLGQACVMTVTIE